MAGLTELAFGCANNTGIPNIRFGIEKGIFEQEGLALRLHQVYGGPELARELDKGRVSIGEFGAPPALTALGHGANFKVIAGGTRRKIMLHFAARTDIASFDALKGGRIGLLSRGSCDEWVAREVCLKNGLDPDRDITFVTMGAKHTSMLDELRAGAIEAVVGAEPHMSAGEAAGVLRVWAPAWDYIPKYQWGLMVARPDFIEEHPDLVDKVIRGAVRAIRYAADHQDEWSAFHAARNNIPLDVSRRVTENDFPHLSLDGGLDMEGLQKAIELQHALGAIDRMFAAEDVVDPRFLPVKLAA